jgi:HD domain
MDQDHAFQIAESGLAAVLPRRWIHAQSVAARADDVTVVVPGDADLLIAAAWLHDVGYAPAIVRSGFHPLDGARYLRDLGTEQRLCGLVAHHSGAAMEAKLRGLDTVLIAEFPQEHSAVADALWYADLTTGPDGGVLTVEERLAEIAERYGPTDVVTAFVELARPELIAAVRRTEARLE